MKTLFGRKYFLIPAAILRNGEAQYIQFLPKPSWLTSVIPSQLKMNLVCIAKAAKIELKKNGSEKLIKSPRNRLAGALSNKPTKRNSSLNQVFHKLDNNKCKCTRAHVQENKSIYLSIYLSIWKPFWKRGYIYIYISLFVRIGLFCPNKVLTPVYEWICTSQLYLREYIHLM